MFLDAVALGAMAMLESQAQMNAAAGLSRLRLQAQSEGNTKLSEIRKQMQETADIKELDRLQTLYADIRERIRR